MRPTASRRTTTALTTTPRSAAPKGRPAGGKLRVRTVVIFSGQTFKVPQGVQRIDSKSTHGWQVRYDGTKMFSDHSSDGSGARAALRLATQELLARMTANPMPAPLERARRADKGSTLPAGISGPILRERAGRHTRTVSLSVLLPRYGQAARVKSLYVGTEGTTTKQRLHAAVKRAVALRDQALARYEADAIKARRQAVRELKALLLK